LSYVIIPGIKKKKKEKKRKKKRKVRRKNKGRKKGRRERTMEETNLSGQRIRVTLILFLVRK
jgi:hypothetical protein